MFHRRPFIVPIIPPRLLARVYVDVSHVLLGDKAVAAVHLRRAPTVLLPHSLFDYSHEFLCGRFSGVSRGMGNSGSTWIRGADFRRVGPGISELTSGTSDVGSKCAIPIFFS